MMGSAFCESQVLFERAMRVKFAGVLHAKQKQLNSTLLRQEGKYYYDVNAHRKPVGEERESSKTAEREVAGVRGHLRLTKLGCTFAAVEAVGTGAAACEGTRLKTTGCAEGAGNKEGAVTGATLWRLGGS